MPFAQYLKTDVEVTDLTLPIFNPNDGWLTPSTLMLFDLRRVKCYPSQLAAVPNGTALVNLAGSTNASVSVATSGVEFASGKLKLTGVANNFFTYGSIDLVALGSPDFLVVMWIRVHPDKSTSNNQSLMHKGATTATIAGYTFILAYNATLGSVRMSVSNGTAQMSGVDVSFTENDVWVQFGFAFEGNKIKIFKNGVPASESTTTLAKPYNTHANPMKSFGQDAWNQFKGDVARIGITKLDEGKTAAERVADDYSANRASINSVL